MELFAAVFNDTDGYTYSCEWIIGVYDERSKADERCLRAAEQGFPDRKGPLDLELFEVRPFKLNEDW